jgi:hypothetical protein
MKWVDNMRFIWFHGHTNKILTLLNSFHRRQWVMPIKTILLLAVVALLVFGCGRNDRSRTEITSADVAWATDTDIAKWDLRALTSKPVYCIGIYLLGPTNEVIKEGPWIGEGAPFVDLRTEPVCLSLHGDEVKLCWGRESVTAQLGDDLKLGFWYGSSLKPFGEWLPVASDATTTATYSEGILKSKTRKLCVRICTTPRPIIAQVNNSTNKAPPLEQ